MIFALKYLHKPLLSKDLGQMGWAPIFVTPYYQRTYVDSLEQIPCQKKEAEAPRSMANRVRKSRAKILKSKS